MKGNKKFRFPGIKQVSRGDVTYSTGTVVPNVVTLWYGLRWLLTYHSDRFLGHTNVE